MEQGGRSSNLFDRTCIHKLQVLIAGNLCVYAEDDNTDVLLMTGEVTSGNSLEISIQGSGEARDTQPVIFKSSKNNVAYMDDNGLIHARGKGTAKITAKVNGKTVKITIKVIV